jgi:hypothetical protein
MTGLNDRVERSAILVDPRHATNALQVSRLAREARHDHLRRFDDAKAMAEWLSEVCDPDERASIEHSSRGAE